MATARDGCVVRTEPLADLLGAYVTSWNRERPATGGRFTEQRRRTEVVTVGALSWISAETGIPKEKIERVAMRRAKMTELRVADAIVTAIGRPEAFHDGTLEVLPNPTAPAHLRGACCAGSTADALERICDTYGSSRPAPSVGASLTGSF